MQQYYQEDEAIYFESKIDGIFLDKDGVGYFTTNYGEVRDDEFDNIGGEIFTTRELAQAECDRRNGGEQIE